MSRRLAPTWLALLSMATMLSFQACDPTTSGPDPMRNYYGDPPVVYSFLNSITGHQTAVRIEFPAYTSTVNVTNPLGFTFLRNRAPVPGLLQPPATIRPLGGFPLPPDPDEFQFDPWDPPLDDPMWIPDFPLPDPLEDPFDGDLPLPLPPLDEIDGTDFSPGALDITNDGPLVGFGNAPQSSSNKSPRAIMVQAVIQVGPAAAGIAHSPDGNTIYVAVGGTGNIAVVDRKARTITARIPLPSGAQPYALAITPDGKRLYTGDFLPNSSASLYSIDLPAGPVKTLSGAGSYITQAIVTRDGTQVWFCNYFGGNILIYDVLTNSAVVALPIQFAWNVAFNRSGTRAYISNGTPGSVGAVAVIDTASLQTLASIPVGMTPKNIRITPSGRHLFVTNYDSDFITQIDPATNRVVRNIPVGGTGANGIAFSHN